MPFLQSNTCAAFSWNDQDVFQGVLLQRNGDMVRVKDFWQSEKIGNRSRAQIIEQAIPALGLDEDTTILVGGNYNKVCFIDLKMPKLSAVDLKSALAFELSKYSPIPVDEIQWGYRVIGKVEDKELFLVRLVYFPEDEWESWVAAASGITEGVDMIIPVIAVLDPEMKGIDVCFGNKNNGSEVYLFKSANEGERQIVCLAPDESMEAVYGVGNSPLSKQGIDLGKLTQLPPDEQAHFSPSVLLGLYGLSNAFYQDRKHWLPVPLDMRPRRNRAHKIYTLVLGFYLLILLGVFGFSTIYKKSKVLNERISESQLVAKELKKAEEATTPETILEGFETEVAEAEGTKFSMARILRELTALTNEKLWCTNFTWDSGDIRVELRAGNDDPDLTLALQNSALLTDITMNKRQIHDGSVNYSITCRARMPEEIEEDANSALVEGEDEKLESEDSELEEFEDEEDEEDEDGPIDQLINEALEEDSDELD